MSTTTTTNYGWTIPNNDELVKDGAAAIRTLGNAADSSLKTVSDGRGLINITATTSFSAVSSVSLAANTFSSTYDNYLIHFQHTASSGASAGLFWRGRTSGTDNTNNNYDWRTFYSDATGIAANTGSNNTSAARFSEGSSSRGTTSMEIFNPFASQPTQINARTYINDGNGYIKYGNAQFDATTSFDSLTIYCDAGTMTGSYTVYGYKK